MEDKKVAKECGLRLRRVRMAKNMSQQALADKMYTTPQNVSKWENQGISDVDTIKELSRILGQDILSDERNEEGVVGEIGKHILKQVAQNNGFIPVDDLIDKHMYGLGVEIVTDEIFKLERIGMCVREQYKNFYDNEEDMLFITAKGVITLNNFSAFGGIMTKTYEQFLEGRSTIQEYYDENQLEKLVRNLCCNSTYRIDYINYLANKYEKCYINEGRDSHGAMKLFENVLPEWEIEYSILFRMIMGLSDKMMCNYLDNLMGDVYGDEEIDELSYDMLEWKYSGRLSYFDSKLYNKSKMIKEWCDNIWAQRETMKKERDETEISEEEKEYLQQKVVVEEALDEYMAFDNGDIEYFIKQRNAFVEGKYPSEWFSIDEIKAFIRDNFRSAETPAEKEIDEILAKINELDPSSLNYYQCSWEWHKAGIDDLIKSYYNLPEINDCIDKQDGDE